MPPRYCNGGFGDVAEETEEESKERVERLGDRGYWLCGGAAIARAGGQRVIRSESPLR